MVLARRGQVCLAISCFLLLTFNQNQLAIAQVLAIDTVTTIATVTETSFSTNRPTTTISICNVPPPCSSLQWGSASQTTDEVLVLLSTKANLAGEISLSDVSSLLKIAMPTLGMQSEAPAADFEPYPNTFPIGGEDVLANLAVELADDGIVRLSNATDNPQHFFSDNQGRIRPINLSDAVLYLHLEDFLDQKRRRSKRQAHNSGGDRTSVSGVNLANIRWKQEKDLDIMDLDTLYVVKDEGIELWGKAGEVQFDFYVGDYIDDQAGHGDGILELLAAPVGQIIDVKGYQIQKVELLPRIVRSQPLSSVPPKASSAPAPTLDAYDVITSEQLNAFCSGWLGYSTLVYATTTLTSLQTRTIEQVYSVDLVSLNSTPSYMGLLNGGTFTAPWLAGMRSDIPKTDRGSLIYPTPTIKARTVETPEALATFPVEAIGSGCSRAVTSPTSFTTSLQTIYITITTTLTVSRTTTRTLSTPTVKSLLFNNLVPTLKPYTRFGFILAYDQGSYATPPGTLFAHYHLIEESETLLPRSIVPTATIPILDTSAQPTPVGVAADLLRTKHKGTIFYADEQGRLFAYHSDAPDTGVKFYWVEKLQNPFAHTFALVPADMIDGKEWRFMGFQVMDDGVVVIDPTAGGVAAEGDLVGFREEGGEIGSNGDDDNGVGDDGEEGDERNGIFIPYAQPPKEGKHPKRRARRGMSLNPGKIPNCFVWCYDNSSQVSEEETDLTAGDCKPQTLTFRRLDIADVVELEDVGIIPSDREKGTMDISRDEKEEEGKVELQFVEHAGRLLRGDREGI